MGDGRHTYFWSDVWVGGEALRDKFNILFDLLVSKWLTVSDMYQFGWGVDGGAWSWR